MKSSLAKSECGAASTECSSLQQMLLPAAELSQQVMHKPCHKAHPGQRLCMAGQGCNQAYSRLQHSNLQGPSGSTANSSVLYCMRCRVHRVDPKDLPGMDAAAAAAAAALPALSFGESAGEVNSSEPTP
jgi:hypothetical protein